MVEVVSATADDCCEALAACSSAVASSSPALAVIWSPPLRICSTRWRRLSNVLLNEAVRAITDGLAPLGAGLDRKVALGGAGQHGRQVLDPHAQLIALLAGDAPLVPDGGIEQADEPGDDRAQRQHDHQEADVALVQGPAERDGHADRDEREAAHEQAACAGHRDSGDEQR